MIWCKIENWILVQVSAPSVRKYVLVSVGLQEVDMVMGGTLSNCTLLNSTHHAFQPNSPSFYWSLPPLLMLLLLLWHIPFFHMTRPIRHPYTVYITFSLLRQNLIQISIFTILNILCPSTIQESRFNICLEVEELKLHNGKAIQESSLFYFPCTYHHQCWQSIVVIGAII